MVRNLRIACVAILLAGISLADETQKLTGERASLSKLQQFIGEWKGVGQPKRGSAKDAWSEECGWAWDFRNGVALAMTSSNGKFMRHAELRAAKDGVFTLEAKSAEGQTAKFTGKLSDDNSLILDAERDSENWPSRLTVRIVAGGDRLLVLYEKRGDGRRLNRLAEVGLTRKGSDFGKGTTFVECVVTGGVGTIAVTHQGKTYYVCCSGCRDYFNDHPDEVLAEYKARKAAEKK